MDLAAANAPLGASTTMTDNKAVLKADNAVLRARGIGKTVKSGDSDLVILRDIDLEITSGEAVAIVGASGSGKSTLLALLAGLDTPSAGSVEVEGASLFELDEDARAELRGRSVGFVFQSFQLLPSLTALENVMLPVELSGKADPEKSAIDVLKRVGLGERLHHYPKHLSGGEQQRVALARAFVTRPKLLLADEPTGSLDADAAAAVIGLLFEMNQEYRTTLVMVTHDESLARRCGRIVRLAAGRVVPPA
jgi:putative ABC transport system ATP-binding protein